MGFCHVLVLPGRQPQIQWVQEKQESFIPPEQGHQDCPRLCLELSSSSMEGKYMNSNLPAGLTEDN